MTKTLADFEKRTTRTHIYKKCTTNTVHWLVIGQNQTKNTTCLIISQNGQPKCPIKAVIFYAYTIIKCFNDVCPHAFLTFGDLLKHTSTSYTHCVYTVKTRVYSYTLK